MSCDWEGNRRSGVALAMRHRLQWFIHLWAQVLSKGDEHRTNTLMGMVPCYGHSLPLPTNPAFLSYYYWATICKTVPLCYRTVVCPVCLSVTLVYCGQTVGWIKMKLGMVVGLDPGHIVLDEDSAPPPKIGGQPKFWANVYCGQTAGWI